MINLIVTFALSFIFSKRKKHTVYLPHLTPNLKMFYALHPQNFVRREHRQSAIIRVSFSLKPKA